ncbi:MAG TPA: LysR substrate-binding domain-containing protein [Rhodoblastus sp.]|nr:LysR substrate-binding domain-containing protein [Rhodoblastus sp.]
MSVSLRQVTAFLAVADAGSFTRAAEQLKVAQPALSQAVRELESSLGLRLFDRTTRRVELTTAGREFRDAAVKIVSDLEFAVRNARDLAGRKRGRVVVAAPPLLAAAVLPQAIVEFSSQYPDVQIVVVDAPTTSIVDTVRSGGADCGIGTFPAGESGIQQIALMRDRLLLFCRADSPFAEAASVRWSDLHRRPLVTLSPTSAIRRLVEIGFETAQIALTPAYEVHQIVTALSLVKAGLGVAVLPTYAYSEAKFREVVARPLGDPEIGRDIEMIHASGRSISPAVSAFVPIVRSVIRRLTPTL